MVSVPKEKWFEHMSLIACGNVTNIKNLKTEKGKNYTTFSLLYARTESEKSYLNCQVWDNQNCKRSSDYANRLEKGDSVLIAGYLREDTYWSEKKGQPEFVLVVDWISVQPLFDDGEVDEVDLTEV